MTLTRDEAARALAEMETAQRRTSVLARYSAGGPILMLWGGEWFVCNLVSQFGGSAANWVWPVATVVTIALTFWISSRRPDPTNRKGWKAFATSAAVGGFFAGLFAILRLHDMQQVNALISLAVASAYVVLGVWTGARYAWLGLAVFAAVMIGFFGFPQLFFLWMAVVGGGALTLGGLWLRKA